MQESITPIHCATRARIPSCRTRASSSKPVRKNTTSSRENRLRRGRNVPQQRAAFLLREGRKIKRVTGGPPLLIKNPQRRQRKKKWVDKANPRFAIPYMPPPRALQRFRASSFVNAIWPDPQDRS